MPIQACKCQLPHSYGVFLRDLGSRENFCRRRLGHLHKKSPKKRRSRRSWCLKMSSTVLEIGSGENDKSVKSKQRHTEMTLLVSLRRSQACAAILAQMHAGLPHQELRCIRTSWACCSPQPLFVPELARLLRTCHEWKSARSGKSSSGKLSGRDSVVIGYRKRSGTPGG